MNREKKRNLWIILGIIAIVVIALIVILNSNNSNSKSVKVGVVIPLTGDAAVYGEEIRNGIEIAQEDLGDASPNVIYEDACLAADALKSAQKLILVDDVKFISGVFCIPAVDTIATLTKEKKISIMMTASVPENLIDLHAYIFSPNSAIKDEAYAQAEYAYYNLSTRNASILWMNSAFGNSYSINFQKRFEELGGTIVSNEPLEFFGLDYKTELAKVKEKHPDVLLAVHFGTQIGLVLKQANEMGLNSKIIGTYEAEDQYVIDSAQGGAEGLILSTPIGGNKGLNYEEFSRKYELKYNKDPAPIARMAYDGLMLQMQAYKKCGKNNQECIMQQIFNTKDYDGASGLFSITQDGTGKRVFVFKTVKNGKYELIN